MIFSSLQFLVFFLVVYVIYLFLKNRGNIYYVFLLLASYYFYMSWSWPFIIVLLFTTLLDFSIGRAIMATDDVKKRKRYVVVSVFVNLGLLAFFKYANFFAENVNGIAHLMGRSGNIMADPNIPLPVGISFFTFKSMSYTVDVYRRSMSAERSLLKFATFVGFFPELVAGPIVRAEVMLPQFHREVNPTVEKFVSGLKLFVLGFFKKLFIADMISAYSDNVFAHPSLMSSYEVWVGVIAYSIQIYCDFSGYTDMAIGVARMMDYNFPENFDRPYISKNITEFWRRWHISLSTWLRDYLYISLGGNRKGRLRTDVNLMLTMILGGLWHGASWTFVIWGTIHGVLLVVHKQWLALKKKFNIPFFDKNPVWIAVSWAMTMLCVATAWVFFRAQGFSTAAVIIGKMYRFDFSGFYYMPTFYFLLILVIIAHVLYPYFYDKQGNFTKNRLIEQLLYAYLILMLLIMAPTHTSPFIYFQF